MQIRIFPRLAETIRAYPLLFLGVLFFIFGIVYLFVPVDFRRDVLAPQGEGDRMYFGDGIVIAQEFTPHAGLAGIEVPLSSATYPNGPLILHIRVTLEGEDIVAAPLFSFHEEIARFRFSPIFRVPDTFVWILEAPHAPENSFWAYREQDASAFPEGKAYHNRRSLKGNIGFTEVWRYPRLALLTASVPSSSLTLADWEYTSILAGAAGVLIFFLGKRFRLNEKMLVVLSIALGAGLHIWLGLVTPVIIDEGSYIQDVLQSSAALLPFRDFLTKGPLYLFFLWLWSFVVPNTVIAWRLFSTIAWALDGWWFWQLTLEWGLRRRSRLLAAGIFNLLPAVVALTTPLLLQTASVAVSMLGLLLVLRAVRQNRWQLAAWSGAIFTIAFLMRVTAAIPALMAAIAYLLLSRSGFKLKLIGAYVGTGVLLFGLVFGLAAATIGLPKASVMTNMEAFLISQNRQERSERAATPGEPLLRSLTIESRLFWRAGVLILTPLLLTPLLLIDRRRLVMTSVILAVTFFIGWQVFFHLTDTDFLLPKKFATTVWLIGALFAGLPFITAVGVLLYGRSEPLRVYWSRWQIPLLICAWLVLTVFAYAKWGRFRQSYLTEFVPQLALLAGVGFDFAFKTWQGIKPRWFSTCLIGSAVFLGTMSFYQGYVIARLYPHTGTIDQASLVNIVRLIEANVPKDEMIFTAQPVVTGLAGRQIVFGYSHPGWYREARFGTISEELRDLLFKKPEEITDYLRSGTNFVLTESRTDEIYFDGYPERAEILKTKFEPLGSVRNEMVGDTYTLYKRN